MIRHISSLIRSHLLTAAVIIVSAAAGTVSAENNIAVIDPGDTPGEIVAKAANVTPAPRQYAWQKRDFIGFIHFTVNTFTDREWGDGAESPSVFNPTEYDAGQWVRVMKEAGMKAVILTCKHHDGFCLWPSRYTDHSVKSSPWRNGKGDIVRDVSDACRREGLAFGVYISPWDRHEPTYGDSPVYNEHFRNQLRELLTQYGDICEVWFDGACGEGPNGKRQVYDWNSYYSLVRELQPGAVIAIMGPDVRWVGTESGYGRVTEWSVVPVEASDRTSIAAGSQQRDVAGLFIPKDLMDEDLGSREIIAKASTLIWYPAEVNTSIRPGWFYHADQDGKVKTPEKLVDTYFCAAGRNGVFLLNLPPDTRGLIHENDVASLRGMRRILDETFRTNLVTGAAVTSSVTREGTRAEAILDSDPETYWMPALEAPGAVIEVRLDGLKTFDTAMLQENILVGQRVERFALDALLDGAWREITGGTTIGYKRLLRFPETTSGRVRLRILESRTSPAIGTLGLYDSPVAHEQIDAAGR